MLVVLIVITLLTAVLAPVSAQEDEPTFHQVRNALASAEQEGADFTMLCELAHQANEIRPMFDFQVYFKQALYCGPQISDEERDELLLIASDIYFLPEARGARNASVLYAMAENIAGTPIDAARTARNIINNGTRLTAADLEMAWLTVWWGTTPRMIDDQQGRGGNGTLNVSADLTRAEVIAVGEEWVHATHSPFAYISLAGMYWPVEGGNEEILRIYEEALELHPDDANLLNNAMFAAGRLGELEQAEDYALRAESLAPCQLTYASYLNDYERNNERATEVADAAFDDCDLTTRYIFNFGRYIMITQPYADFEAQLDLALDLFERFPESSLIADMVAGAYWNTNDDANELRYRRIADANWVAEWSSQ